MPDPRQKECVITFKTDASLLEALRTMPNRSDFIRGAILAALDNQCPLCRGTGLLTPNQKSHWQKFLRNHALRECAECHEVRLVCSQRGDSGPAAARGRGPLRPRRTGRIRRVEE